MMEMDEYQRQLTMAASCGYMNDTISNKIVGILHTCSACISFFSSLLVIALIFLFKKHQFFVQRLILYLGIAALLYSAAAALANTNYNSINDFPQDFCKAMGFLTQYTQWTLLLSIAIITVDILLRVCFNRPTNVLEPVYIIVIVLVPMSFNWIPFLYDMYGPAGGWCWIKLRTLNNLSCEPNDTGIIFQFSLWYGPLFVMLLLILIAYAIIMIVLRQYKRRMNIYNFDEIQLLKRMRREVFILMWYPVIYMIINLFPLANRIIDATLNEPIYVLWLLHAIISPLQGGFIVIVYALDPETRRKLTFQGISGAVCQCFHRNEGNIKEYSAAIMHDTENDHSNSPLLLQDSK